MPYHIICDYNQEIYNSLDIKRTATKEERQPTDEADKAKLAAKMEKVKASGFVHGDYEGNEQQLPAMFITDDRGNVLYAHYAKYAYCGRDLGYYRQLTVIKVKPHRKR